MNQHVALDPEIPESLRHYYEPGRRAEKPA